MLNELNITTIKFRDKFISECCVLDTITQKKYYVVSQIGKTLYATFDNSYIGYLKHKNKKPQKLEGENFMFFDLNNRFINTRFNKQYKLTYEASIFEKRKHYLNRKYSHIKKPTCNLNYVIIEKKSVSNNVEKLYEMEVFLYTKKYYIFSNSYSIYKISRTEFNLCDKDSDIIESLDSFDKCKKSKFYSLYLEMEKYKDNYNM